MSAAIPTPATPADPNSQTHRDRRLLQRELQQRIADLKRGLRIDQYIGLPEPQDHTADYDRVITMAEMSSDDTIQLSEDQFAMYVTDQWRWKQDFADSTLCDLQ